MLNYYRYKETRVLDYTYIINNIYVYRYDEKKKQKTKKTIQ